MSGLQTIDGEITAAGDRVLVMAQTDQTRNGIYIASAGAWQRARDMDSSRDVTKGTRLTVIEGATLAGKEYQITTDNPIALGADAVTFVETLSSDAGSSAAAAAASASAAAASETAAGTSETNAAYSASAASASEAAAAGSASTAAASASSASASAGSASGYASTAATSAGQAMGFRNQAEGYKDDAVAAATEASGFKDLAQRWAEEDEDVEVEAGAYSAKHWAMKSQESASEVTSVNGKTGAVVLDATDVGAATAAQGALADGAIPKGGRAAVSVIGRSANSSGDAADIAAGANDRILARVSNALSWVQLTLGMIPDSLITFAKLASGAIASFAEFNSATASKLLSTASVWGSTVALTDAATIAWNQNNGYDAKVTIGGNRTLGAATNIREGKKGVLHVKATGATRTLTLDSSYKLQTGVEAGPYSITTTEKLLVAYLCEDGVVEITGVMRRPL